MNKERANSVLDELLRIFFFIAKKKDKGFEFDQTQEVKMMSDYLKKDLLPVASIEEKNLVINQLTLYNKNEIKKNYNSVIETLLDQAHHVSALKEKLHLIILEKYVSLNTEYEQSLQQTIKEYADFNAFYTDLITIRKELKDGYMHNFTNCINFFGRNYPQQTKDLFDYAFTNDQESLGAYITLLKFHYQETEYYNKQIKRIWKIGGDASERNVVWLIGFGRDKNPEFINQEDFHYLNIVVDNANNFALGTLSMYVGALFHVDAAKAKEITIKLLKGDEINHIKEHTISETFDNKELVPSYSRQLLEIAYDTILDVKINNYYYSKILNFIENEFGFDALLKFLSKKLEELEKSGEYFAMFISDTYKNPSNSFDQAEDNFIQAIKWYMSQPTTRPLLHDKLVEYLLPAQLMSDTMKNKFINLIESYEGNKDDLMKLSKFLRLSTSPNKNNYDVVIYLAERYLECNGGSKNAIEDIFGSNLRMNMGMKSTSGGAFPSDIARKKLLEEVLESEMSSVIYQVLKESLDRIIKTIEYDDNQYKQQW